MPQYYTHNIDPFIFRFNLDFLPLPGIPWYGTMYLLGFIAGYFLLERLRKEGFLPLKSKKETEDLVNYSVFGVIIGGRLGHFIFYQPEIFLTDPLEILKVWHGGMASHGGIIGVIVAMTLFARKYKLSTLKIVDTASLCAIPGLGFGRIGNFINAEYPGKTTDVAWAVIFPKTDMFPRHPSQLYQAIGEGAFLFIVLWFILPRHKFKEGFLFASFIVAYGIQRIVTEIFREESGELRSMIEGITQGQLLSITMILIGCIIMYLTQRKAKII